MVRVYYPDIGWVDVSEQMEEKNIELYKNNLDAINAFLANPTPAEWQKTKLGAGQCTLPLTCKDCPFASVLAKLQELPEEKVVCNLTHRSRLPFPEILNCCVQLAGIAQAACEAYKKEHERGK